MGFWCGSNEGGGVSGGGERAPDSISLPQPKEGTAGNQITAYLSTLPFILCNMCFLPFALSKTSKFSFPTPWAMPRSLWLPCFPMGSLNGPRSHFLLVLTCSSAAKSCHCSGDTSKLSKVVSQWFYQVSPFWETGRWLLGPGCHGRGRGGRDY